LPGEVRLKLTDLCPRPAIEELYPDAMCDVDEEITITFEELSDLLTAAEANLVEQNQGRTFYDDYIAIPRAATPEETLSIDDEEVLLRLEAEVTERADSEDGEYTPEN